VGSLYTKTVFLDGDGNVVAKDIIRSGAIYQGAAENSFAHALEQVGLERGDIGYTVGTGYGRAKVLFADKEITEITCHGRGSHWLFPEAHTIIDIGGQDTKVIWLNDAGNLRSFVMNDKCAAGTGRFLEVMAATMGLGMEEMGPLSLLSKYNVEISSLCTVFAESEIISLFAQSCALEDICAGLHRAIASRIAGMVAQVGIRERVVMSGGVAQNIGVVKTLEQRLKTSLLIPDEPQIVGALGAALIAWEISNGKQEEIKAALRSTVFDREA